METRRGRASQYSPSSSLGSFCSANRFIQLSFSVLLFAYDSGFPFFLWAVKLARMYQRRCSWEALPQWSALWQSISRRIVNIGNEVAARLLLTKRRRDLSKWMYAAGLTCRLPSPIVFLVLMPAIWRWTRAWRIRRVLVEDDGEILRAGDDLTTAAKMRAGGKVLYGAKIEKETVDGGTRTMLRVHSRRPTLI